MPIDNLGKLIQGFLYLCKISDGDVYLLDDPLSAVDAHVGQHIFEHVIGPNGLLKDKTRIVVTHKINYLSQFDKIVYLKNGEIAELGTYEELINKKNEFSQFLLQHSQDDQKDDNETKTTDDEKKTKKILKDKKANGKLTTNEHVETHSVGMKVYFFFLKAFGLKNVIFLIIASILQTALGIGSDAWLSYWSDIATENEVKYDDTKFQYLAIYGVLGGLAAFNIFLQVILQTHGGVNASKKLHNNMIQKVLQAPMSFFDTNPKGRIVNRFSSDISIIDSSIPGDLGNSLVCFLNLLGVIVVISSSIPVFLACLVPISVCYFCLQMFYIKSTRQMTRTMLATKSPIYSWFSETFNGISTIKAYNLEGPFTRTLETKNDNNMKSTFLMAQANAWLSFRLEILGNMIVFLTALFAVLGRESGSMSGGVVGFTLTYALQITDKLSDLINQLTDTENDMVAAERVKEYQTSIPQESDRIKPDDPDAKSWPVDGSIQMDNLHARYRDELPLVLNGVSLDIKAGEKVGIVGRTGSGKSSLTLSMFRTMEAAQGSIRVDDRNIADLGVETLRSALTIIPQDPVLFSGTLKLNLDPFGKYSDDKLWKALELSHLKKMVSSLPLGLGHKVSEGGSNLSVGERQLLCLARAVLKKTKILILDEATAAVDLETDDLIQATIRSEFSDCTILTIAHRINTIIDSDKVVVMDKGIVVEFDSPQNLLNRTDSEFYSLAKESKIVQ